MHPHIYLMEYCHGSFIFKWKNHLVTGNLCNIVNVQCLFFYFDKEQRLMLGVHLILVTIHMQFTINVEQDTCSW